MRYAYVTVRRRVTVPPSPETNRRRSSFDECLPETLTEPLYIAKFLSVGCVHVAPATCVRDSRSQIGKWSVATSEGESTAELRLTPVQIDARDRRGTRETAAGL